ncbi:MAG TPA: PqqD family protein [Pilimelia sp.]|nr:PqqD family protein [Pilimelia sp.]
MLKINECAVEWRLVDGEIIALDLASEEYLAVNRTGAALWPLLAAGATEDDLTDQLVRVFDVPAPAASADVATFVAGLRTRGLLTAAQR